MNTQHTIWCQTSSYRHETSRWYVSHMHMTHNRLSMAIHCAHTLA